MNKGETPMKRLLVFATVVIVAVTASGLLLAQSNPFVGRWKLNLAKSKDTGAFPKEETLTVQLAGDQRKVTINGTGADGSPISFKYEVPDKGGAGKVLAGGPYDAVSGKRIDDNTREVSYMKGGKEVLQLRTAVSKDGNTMRLTVEGTDAQGKPFSGVAVFEKQYFGFRSTLRRHHINFPRLVLNGTVLLHAKPQHRGVKDAI